ncbi:MAG: glutathione S-transferase, partial [Sinobacterium sp.]|nr:glutathione S-transferase [Sinobacterium sp.]
RQQARILSSLKQLEESPQRYKKFDPLNDWHIRLACFLDWASFRHRITIENYPNLQLLVEAALQNNAFAQTRPTE